MSLNSKVSIIIPMFNQARYAAQSIASALAQTHPNIEVIAVDDGSTDSTPAVAAQFNGNPKFKCLRQENTGLPGARNRGLAEATGDYVCFLDSDDYYAPEKTARQARLLDENPEVGFVYCDIVTVDPAGQPVAEQFSVGKVSRALSGNIFQSLLLGGFFPPHTVMIRRGILAELGGFDPELGGHADYELWLRVAAAGHKACYLDEALAFYRTHPDSMSKDGLHMNETRIAAFERIARRFPEKLAAGLNHLQQTAEDYFHANQLLKHVIAAEELDCSGPEKSAGRKNGGTVQTYAFLLHVTDARLIKGNPDQLAVWEATIDDRDAKCIYLQPPAELKFRVPGGAGGQFSTAIAIHPDAWEKPGAGGCEFHVRMDGRAVFVMAIDPVRLASDRHWHEIKIEVPENPAGHHDITLETKSIGANSFRWALWRAPKFNSVAAPAALKGGMA